MQQIKVWLSAARLRTLPLSISGILVGNALSLNQPDFSWSLFVLMLLTAISFQIISNFANDYGDGVKGTDNENRIGPKRVFQQGLLSKQVLKNGIIVMSLVALLLACILIFIAFGAQFLVYGAVFFLLALLSVWAAISYTVGDKAYGYRGLGDIFVLLFFGGVGVLGSYFVQLKTFSWPVLLLGAKAAKRYHFILIGSAILLITTVFLITSYTFFWIPFIALIPLIMHLIMVIKISDPKQFDPELKKVALSTFFLSVLIFITLLIG